MKRWGFGVFELSFFYSMKWKWFYASIVGFCSCRVSILYTFMHKRNMLCTKISNNLQATDRYSPKLRAKANWDTLERKYLRAVVLNFKPRIIKNRRAKIHFKHRCSWRVVDTHVILKLHAKLFIRNVSISVLRV